MVSEVLTTLCSGHHLCEGSRCQVVELLVPGKQHFQMLITSKLDHKLIEKRRREEEKNCCESVLYSIPNNRTHNASSAQLVM